MFLGAAVGDALGWPQEQNSGFVGGQSNRQVDPKPEFQDWVRYNGGQYRRYLDPISAGEYSDDTQLILAVARALQTPDWFATLTRTELPLFLLYQRGAGASTLRACRSWAAGSAPWEGGTSEKSQKAQQRYFSAGGNGVAMRIAPHAVSCGTLDRLELVGRVIKDGVATHGHPRALVGAAAYAVALHKLLTIDGPLEYGSLATELVEDTSWQDAELAMDALPEGWVKAASQFQADVLEWWRTAVDETRELLSLAQRGIESGVLGNDVDVLSGLGCFDKRVNGAGTRSCVGAVYLASRTAPRPISGLVGAAFLRNADSDTLASMTAGLLGALHGPKWLGNMGIAVQDRRYIEGMADRCVDLALGSEHYEAMPPPLRDRDLAGFRNALASREPQTFLDGRQITSSKSFALESKTGANVQRWVLQLDLQKVVVDIVDSTIVGRNHARGSSSPVESPRAAALQWVSLLAPDLDQIDSFYGSGGLGLDTFRPSSNELYIGRFLRFVFLAGYKDDSGAHRPVLLNIEVNDFDAVVNRVGAEAADHSSARVKDPVGNDIWITRTR
ncbi:ADP-ribosylglycohydrolase family protein [Mycolicibacterium fluoranthenivorans]|nr:ADP-ribosylglycohydrolase family protein [Mycolicibacterium fluoranthenivorans]MCV7356000.1 ADP-ribosylglycohydrolase family protein [Mycolicibacterium fluoranthenivorans]